jgi:hypothetical protein
MGADNGVALVMSGHVEIAVCENGIHLIEALDVIWGIWGHCG